MKNNKTLVFVFHLQTAHKQFVQQSRSHQPSGRDALLKEMASAYDAFMELKNHLKEGSKFYNDLTQVGISFKGKVKA